MCAPSAMLHIQLYECMCSTDVQLIKLYMTCRKVFKLVFLSSITTPQDAHTRSVLLVYLGSNTLEFGAIRR